MDDPLPQNIDGRKLVEESYARESNVSYHVDVGQVALGVAGIALTYVLYKIFVEDSDGESEEFDTIEEVGDAAEIPVGGRDGVVLGDTGV